MRFINLFTNLFLEDLERDAVKALYLASKNGAILSFSGGIDSTVINYIIKKFYIPINEIFYNNEVEPNGNKKIIKKVKKTYFREHEAKTESYKSIVNRLGFPIKNKNFSELCYRVSVSDISESNIIDKFRCVTGVSPFKINCSKINDTFMLPLDFWYLAFNFPIQQRCCSILKKAPASKVKNILQEKYIKENRAKREDIKVWFNRGLSEIPKHVLDHEEPITPMIIGIMKDDSQQRRRAINQAYHGKYFPLESWNKSDVIAYAKKENIDISSEYKDRMVKDVKIIGSTNTGCVGCHFGNTVSHFIEVDGVKIATTKFDKLKIERPKLHNSIMNMSHHTGITFMETIKAYDDSNDGKFINESIKIRNSFILELKDFMTKSTKHNFSRQSFDLLMSYYIKEKESK